MVFRVANARAAACLLMALVVLTLGGGIASAHGGAHPEPGSDLPRVLAVAPPTAGLSITVIEGGLRLRLDNATGAEVEVRPPPGVARDQEPLVPPGGSAAWADARVAGAQWSIPLVTGGRVVTVHGDRVEPVPPLPVPWWAATVFAASATFCLGAVAVERGRRSRVALAVAGVTALVVGAHVLHVLGSVLVLARPPSAAGVVAGAGIGVVCWVLGTAGVALTLARREFGLLTCGCAGALTALVSLFDTASFHRPVLAFAWSFDVDRLTTVLTVGAGIGLFLTGCAAMSGLGATAAPAGGEPARNPA